MFDVQKVKTYGEANISLDGTTIFLNGQAVTDEKTKEDIRIASLIYEEATFEFDRLKEEGKSDVSLEDLMEKAIHKYGLNGEVSNDPENKAINKILQYEHLEIPLYNESLKKSDYRILARTEKGRGLAVLKRAAQKRGFNIEGLSLGFDPKARVLHVDYKKVPFVKTNLPFGLSLNDKIQDAQRHLEESVKNNDEVMTQYYNDLLNSYKNVPLNKESKQTYSEVQDLKSTSAPSISKWQENLPDGELADYEYPAQDDLEKLYAGKMSTLQKGNGDLATEYDKALMFKLTSFPITMTPEIWQSLSTNGKKRFYSLKILEAKILNRREALTYWSSTLHKLEEKEKKM